MGWGCYRHEMDSGSENWKKASAKVVAQAGNEHMARSETICPLCHAEKEADRAILEAKVKLYQEQHVRPGRRQELDLRVAMLEGLRAGDERKDTPAEILSVGHAVLERHMKPLDLVAFRKRTAPLVADVTIDAIAPRWALAIGLGHLERPYVARTVNVIRRMMQCGTNDPVPKKVTGSDPLASGLARMAAWPWSRTEEAIEEVGELVANLLGESGKQRRDAKDLGRLLTQACEPGWRSHPEEVQVSLRITDTHWLRGTVTRADVDRRSDVATRLQRLAAGDPFDEMHESSGRHIGGTVADWIGEELLQREVKESAYALARTIEWNHQLGQYECTEQDPAVDHEGATLHDTINDGQEGKLSHGTLVDRCARIVMYQIDDWLTGEGMGMFDLAGLAGSKTTAS